MQENSSTPKKDESTLPPPEEKEEPKKEPLLPILPKEDEKEEPPLLVQEKRDQEASDKNKVQFAMDLYQDKQELIFFADTKAACLLLLEGAILSFILNISPSLTKLYKSALPKLYLYFVFLLFAVVLLFILYAAFLALKALLPRFVTFENRVKAPLMIFFSTINATFKSTEEYTQKLKKLTPEDLLKDLSHQIVQVSWILGIKYQSISASARCLAFSFPLLTLLYVCIEFSSVTNP